LTDLPRPAHKGEKCVPRQSGEARSDVRSCADQCGPVLDGDFDVSQSVFLDAELIGYCETRNAFTFW